MKSNSSVKQLLNKKVAYNRKLNSNFKLYTSNKAADSTPMEYIMQMLFNPYYFN